MKPHLQCAEQQVSRSNLTKYCACHAERLAYLVLITYETSFTMRGATGVTIQPHQILRLSCRKTHILSPHHIWNVIYSARSNRCHDPTSPNTAPATQNCIAKFLTKSLKTDETSFPMRGRSETDPTMIRPWSDHDPTMKTQTATRLATEVTFRAHHEHFLLKNTTFRAQSYIHTFTKCCACHKKWHLNFTKYCTCHEKWRLNFTKYCTCHTKWLACLIVVTYETSFPMRGATGITIQPHQILRLPHKMTRMLDPRHIWNLISNARSNRYHDPTSPNTAPGTKNDTARFQRKSPKTGETSFPMRGRSDHDPSMIRAWSDHDPTMIRPWKRKPQPASQVSLLFEVPRSTFYCKIQRFAPNLTFKPSPNTAPTTKRYTWPSPSAAPATKSDTWTSPSTAPATQNGSRAWLSSHMKPHFQCAEQQVSRSNLTKYCACHTKWLACLILVTYETSFPMRGATGITIQPHQILRLARKMTLQDFKENLQKQVKRHFQCGADPTMIRAWSEHDPTMIRPWSDHENANRNPPRKWACFSRSPEAFSIVKYNVSRPILHSNLHQILRLPQKDTLDLHQVLHLPRKVTLELHQVLRLPRKVTSPTSASTAPATKSDTSTSPSTAPATVL